MKNKFLLPIVALFTMATASAENNIPTWINNVKFSGYTMLQYQYTGKPKEKDNTFNIRFTRLTLDGRAGTDWYWKIQLQLNGNTSTLTASPRIVDAFAEWQKYEFFRVKVGEFKRGFTFESPMSPIDQGFMGFSQNVSKLSYFSDRVGAISSNGRDLGIQAQGDLLKNNAGRNLLHYQVGVYNGQGINTSDVDNRKDIVGGVWVMPVKGMRLGVFGSEGSYARKGTWTNEQGNMVDGVRSLPQHRYAISGEYIVNDWTFRSEYIHSTGRAFKTTYNSSADASKCDLNDQIGDKSDGVYALAIAPIVQGKFYAKARYDLYRPSGNWSDAKTNYEVGLNYNFHPNIQLKGEYVRVNDRSLPTHNYDMIDVQLDFKF